MPLPPLVLVVDDDPDVLEAVGDALELAGYRVALAPHGVEALARVASARPDVVLLDLVMPVMDGAAFSEELRRRGEGDIPIVVLSAEGDPQRAASIGAQAFLAKPFERRALLVQVASMTSPPPGGQSRPSGSR